MEAKRLFDLCLTMQNFCEKTKDEDFNKNIFSVKFKILFFVSNFKKISPSTLVFLLNMAKSNVALFCKQLMFEGYIKSTQDEFDHRVLYYCLTKEGEEYVANNFKKLQNHLEQKFDENKLQNLKKHINLIEDIFNN